MGVLSHKRALSNPFLAFTNWSSSWPANLLRTWRCQSWSCRRRTWVIFSWPSKEAEKEAGCCVQNAAFEIPLISISKFLGICFLLLCELWVEWCDLESCEYLSTFLATCFYVHYSTWHIRHTISSISYFVAPVLYNPKQEALFSCLFLGLPWIGKHGASWALIVLSDVLQPRSTSWEVWECVLFLSLFCG